MGTSHDVIIRLTKKWSKLPNLTGFSFENMVVPNISFDVWANTISFCFIEHDDESCFIASISQFIKAWQRRDNNIWKIERVFWGGLEDYLYPEDWNIELHDIFPYRIDKEWGGKKLISDNTFLQDHFFPVNNSNVQRVTL